MPEANVVPTSVVGTTGIVGAATTVTAPSGFAGVFGSVLSTSTLVTRLAVVFPAASLASARISYRPSATPVVANERANGGATAGAPMAVYGTADPSVR